MVLPAQSVREGVLGAFLAPTIQKTGHNAGSLNGAGEETLTLDLFLGKEAL